MIQNDFFKNEECYIEDFNDRYYTYHDRDGAEFLAKSFFSYFAFDVFSAPESNVIDFAIRKNGKFYTVQVKGSSFRKDKEVYQYESPQEERIYLIDQMEIEFYHNGKNIHLKMYKFLLLLQTI